MDNRLVVGMALGGIGGFNAHDAGVLAAAHEVGVRPDIITCTSGAIFWTYQFLTDPEGIEAEVRRQAEAVSEDNALLVAMVGDPGVFKPAYIPYWTRWLSPPTRSPFWDLLDRLFPAQIYEPTRPKQFYADVARAFSDTPIPIMFNAYSIESGRELVFCNQPAFDFLHRSPQDVRPHVIPGEDMSTEYCPIDAEGVRASLWLTLYGFSNRYEGERAIDGAYHRQIIMSELSDCDIIYGIKPQASAWHARPPGNYFEVQDFNTEMWFNTSFAAEVAGLWAAQRDPTRDPIRIEPITMHKPLGYFNYFVEKFGRYTEGYEQAKRVFQRDLVATTTGRTKEQSGTQTQPKSRSRTTPAESARLHDGSAKSVRGG